MCDIYQEHSPAPGPFVVELQLSHIMKESRQACFTFLCFIVHVTDLFICFVEDLFDAVLSQRLTMRQQPKLWQIWQSSPRQCSRCFPAHNELAICRASLVASEQCLAMICINLTSAKCCRFEPFFNLAVDKDLSISRVPCSDTRASSFSLM